MKTVTKRWILLALGGIVVAAWLANIGCEQEVTPTGLTPTDTTTTDTLWASRVGTWGGTYNDTVYGVMAGLSAVIAPSGSTTFSFTFPYGGGNATGTAYGSINGDTLTATFRSAGVGSGSVAIVDTVISGGASFTVPWTDSFTFTGTVRGDTATGTFDHISPTGGAGTWTLIKQ